MMPYRVTVRIHNRSRARRADRPTLISMSVGARKAATGKPAPHPNTWVFHEGEFARYHDVKLGLMTHALHYGTGVFEGIRAYWNAKQQQLFLLEAAQHYERMRRSANVMRMTLPHSTEELVNFTLDLQGIDHPAYNQDRGPALIAGARVHLEY